jgi:hypothetical protein
MSQSMTSADRPIERSNVELPTWLSWLRSENELALGFLGSMLVLLGSIQANSPFTSKIPGSWFFGVPVNPEPGSSWLELLSTWVIYLGMALTIFVWARLAVSLYRGRTVAMARLWLMFALWVVPLMIAGPLLSRDVYSYAAQGEMVSLGFSPYKHGPFVLGKNPFLLAVDPMWGNAPAPYGPVFLSIASLFVRLSGSSVLGTVVLLRLAALGGVVLVGIYAPKIATMLGYPPQGAFVLGVLNPISLYDLASAGHNDAWMLGLMVAGVYYCMAKRFVLGIILISLAAAVKAPALEALAFVGYNWSAEQTFFKRAPRAIIAGVIALGTLVILGYVTGLGVGWVKSLSTPGVVLSPADPITAAATWVHSLTAFVGLPVSIHLYLSVMRLIGLAFAGGFAIWLALRSNRRRMTRSLGISLLVLVFLGPVIWPWYLSWGIALVACSVAEYGAYSLIAVSVIGFPLSFPGGGQSMVSWIAYVLAIALALVALGYWRQWISLRSRMQIDEIIIRLRYMVEKELGRQVEFW